MELDLKKIELREINSKLQNLDKSHTEKNFTITNPKGCHALCVGLIQKMDAVSYTHLRAHET